MGHQKEKKEGNIIAGCFASIMMMLYILISIYIGIKIISMLS